QFSLCSVIVVSLVVIVTATGEEYSATSGWNGSSPGLSSRLGKYYKQRWTKEALVQGEFNRTSKAKSGEVEDGEESLGEGEDGFSSEFLFEEDIFMSSFNGDGSGRSRRAATARRERIWDFGVIPYEIDGNFSGAHKTLFKQAMRHWENSTCVKFVERTEEHPNYIVFTEKACGCCSFVGKRGNGPQRILTEEVKILGESYDFDSIMHYARNTFSRSTFLDTILPREDPRDRHRPEIGQRIRLSLGDIAQANRLYKCPKCGRTLLEPSGWFASPYHPTTYSNQSSTSGGNNAQVVDRSVGLNIPQIPPPPLIPGFGEKCEWRIVATHGETIVLNITDFDLPFSDGCKHDYLEIRDGYWHKSPLLGRFCGPNLRFDRPIVSTGSRMVLTYSTTKSVESYRGFHAYYEAVCGGELFGENGHLESPNFPDEYLASKECIWKITVPEGYQVSLQFHSFEIENHENCVYDFLEIRDGISQNSTLMGTYCGYYPPAPLTSTMMGVSKKRVFQRVIKRNLMSARGDLMIVNIPAKIRLGHTHVAVNSDLNSIQMGEKCEDACGGIIEEENGTLTSPSFPNLYPSNKHCAWEIIAPPQTRITINFTHFDLEGNNQECDYDSVEVYSKLSQDELKRHGSFCGPDRQGNSIRIVFTSDNSVQKTGFALVYFTDKDECATDNGGCAQICRNTVGSYMCLCYNGFTLHSNGHDCKEGGCKFDLSTPSHTNELASPNYPEPYPGKKECIWIISTIQGHRVKLVFDELEVEQHPECTYDAVYIYDGSNSDMTLLGKFCGSKIPPPVTSSSNQMMILFKSDGSVHRRGFHAKHYSVCGGVLFALTQEEYIYSHANYGDTMYGDSEDCEWIIEMAADDEAGADTDDLLIDHEEWQQRQQALGPQDYVVELTFLSFEVEDENDCAFDFVEIFNGDDASTQSKSLGRYCGNRLPPPIRSDENGALVIRFKSDDTVNAKGFAAVYRAVSTMEMNNKMKPAIKIPPPVPINPQTPTNTSTSVILPPTNGNTNTNINHMINNDSQETPPTVAKKTIVQRHIVEPSPSPLPPPLPPIIESAFNITTSEEESSVSSSSSSEMTNHLPNTQRYSRRLRKNLAK
ncbi:Tolloid-like protein 2, partial [Orchesella cincta]